MNQPPLPPVPPLADPPGQQPQAGKRQRKAPAAPQQRKRPKKEAEGAAASGTADGGGAGATPPKKPPRPKSGGGGAKGGGKKGGGARDKGLADEDGLELLEGEDTKVEDEPEELLGKTHCGVFAKDLPWLMFGFGDADKPLRETVDLVEDIAVQYITDVVHAAMGAAAARNPAPPAAGGGGGGGGGGSGGGGGAHKKDELRLEDLLYAVRRDPRKLARIQELIRRQQEIKDARRVMDVEGGVEEAADL